MASEQKERAVRPITVVKFAGAVIATLIGSGVRLRAGGHAVLRRVRHERHHRVHHRHPAVRGHERRAPGLRLQAQGGERFLGVATSAASTWARSWSGSPSCSVSLVGIIMVSGAGATLNQYFGVPQIVGSGLMAAIVLLSALFGLKRIVDISAPSGP